MKFLDKIFKRKNDTDDNVIISFVPNKKIEETKKDKNESIDENYAEQYKPLLTKIIDKYYKAEKDDEPIELARTSLYSDEITQHTESKYGIKYNPVYLNFVNGSFELNSVMSDKQGESLLLTVIWDYDEMHADLFLKERIMKKINRNVDSINKTLLKYGFVIMTKNDRGFDVVARIIPKKWTEKERESFNG